MVLDYMAWNVNQQQFPDLPFTSHQIFSCIVTCKSPGQHGKGMALTNKGRKKRKAAVVREPLTPEWVSMSGTWR